MSAFRTMSGSVYVVDAAAPRTRRTKLGDGRRPDGLWSERTVYVSPAAAFFLQIRLECGMRLTDAEDGKLCLLTPDGKRIPFPQQLRPAPGLHPAEHYGDGWHIGHRIVETSAAESDALTATKEGDA